MFSFNISISGGTKTAQLEDLRQKVLDYARLNVKEKTYSAYAHALDCLIGFLGNKKICHISTTDLQNFIAVRKKTICNKTGRHYSLFSLNIEIAVLKKSFSIAEDENWLQKNPALKIKKFKVKSEVEAFTDEQLELFLDTVKSNTKNIHYYYAVRLGILIGLRKSEIANLKWPQIDFRNNRISLYNKMTKESEYAYFNDAAGAIFNELKKSNVIDIEGFIWGKPLNQRNLTRTFNYWRDKLELSKMLRFHSTRHTAITRWANKYPFPIAMELARHHSAEMTRRYIHTRDKQLKKAIGEDM
jgi:integrase